ncbi:cobalamin-independent synthase [Fomitopsis serialis]|uniref:cobalamin-independent synthase n=1 Tax=Fomitopsis serialis TaxID=139415 RepID=UPI002008094C|nr:cobalamin-independent synthase [Neoantrodia serialis]KAH9916002.1 cobalamin-independent synthase [Neoantrodia serialis]
MLTGLDTILHWPFPHVDISREHQFMQLALVLRDEPSTSRRPCRLTGPRLHEGLPFPQGWDAYAQCVLLSIKLSTICVTDSLQTHSHFCYSGFDGIFPSIQEPDTDAISTDASKSDAYNFESAARCDHWKVL